MLDGLFVRNSQFLPSFPSAARQYPATIGRGHTLAETVLVFSLFAGGLIGALHNRIVLP